MYESVYARIQEFISENINKAYDLKTWVKENKKKPIVAVSKIRYTRFNISLYCREYDIQVTERKQNRLFDIKKKVDDIV